MDNIICYMAATALAGKMLDQGIIKMKEFLAFEDRMRVKYGLPECSLYRDLHLLYDPDRR